MNALVQRNYFRVEQRNAGDPLYEVIETPGTPLTLRGNTFDTIPHAGRRALVHETTELDQRHRVKWSQARVEGYIVSEQEDRLLRKFLIEEVPEQDKLSLAHTVAASFPQSQIYFTQLR